MREDLKFFSKSSKAPIFIHLAGVTYPDAFYHIERPNSVVTVIEYVTDGCGYVYENGKAVKVEKDGIYMIPKGEDHKYYADRETPYTKIFLNVGGSMCNDILASYNLMGKHFFSGYGLKPIFEKIPKLIHSDLSECEIQSALQGVFIEIISRLSLLEREAAHSPEALSLKSYIDSNLSRIVSVKELSSVIFRSSDYCQKLFSKEFGATPYSYQLDRKIQIAKSLLTNTNMTIEEISSSLGYTDAHYFSNLFVDKCGCRPLSYRKKQR